MEYVIFGIIAAILLYLFVRHDSEKREEMISQFFEGRESLSPIDFYEKYYQEKGVSKNIVIKILEILEEELETKLCQLKPEDDLSNNLRFLFEFDSMADVSLVENIEKTFFIKISDIEAENIKTIDSLIFFIHERTVNA